MSVSDKRIEEFAYYLWESEGRPDGKDKEHWEKARKLAEAEDQAPARLPRKAPKKPKDDAPAAAVKEPAAPRAKAAKPAPKAATSKAAQEPASTSKAAPKAATAEKKPRASRSKPAAS
ncbi:DUF2934 domain-containing protein [Pseudomonas massiliensis]|uniref:DUF2934 domain-containing protein n=1 Tax=Pseudomonas massiliensis TaxID=522492 RepID=UPI00058F04C6|nr:DUF2934 domain-containing protein [Pseudomonas massiliensis]